MKIYHCPGVHLLATSLEMGFLQRTTILKWLSKPSNVSVSRIGPMSSVFLGEHVRGELVDEFFSTPFLFKLRKSTGSKPQTYLLTPEGYIYFTFAGYLLTSLLKITGCHK